MSLLRGVTADPSRLHDCTWKEYAIRFAFGGIITVVAGLLAQRFGPAIGGLFLAFPAILPASLTMIEKHGGTEAAAQDARGSIAGSVGLIAFAVVMWQAGERLAPWAALLLATAVWLVVSVLAWLLLERVPGSRDRETTGSPDQSGERSGSAGRSATTPRRTA